MNTAFSLHPHKGETLTVTPNRSHGSFWVDIRVGPTRITIFADDAEHLQAIMAALKASS